MRSIYLLRPFPKAVHIAIWIVYFGWISWGNINLHGINHVKVLLLVIPLMLGIIYLNRYGLRKLIVLQRISRKTIGWMLVTVLALGMVLYLALYVWPTGLTELILPETPIHGIWLYILDFVAFYGSFAGKGIGLGLAEATVSLLQWRRSTVEQQRAQTIKLQRQAELKKWLNHFMGNIAQHMPQIIIAGGTSRKVIEAYVALTSRCIRLMARKNMKVSLENEIHDLRRLADLFADNPIVLRLPHETYGYQILPMLLLGLFKNMCKHGEFGGDALPGVFTVTATADKLVVHTENQIAAHSAWLYHEGGTGLEQLERILYLHYGEDATLHYKKEDGLFRVSMTISKWSMTEENNKNSMEQID